MGTPDTTELLRAYCQEGSHAAFRGLVERYMPLVYAAARRRSGSHDLAKEVAQQVFTDLAAKAPALAWDDRLGAWLHRRAVFVAADLLKAERRRQQRETTAYQLMQISAPQTDAALEPLLDEALQRLTTKDREVLTLRYLEARNLRQVGQSLNISDDAAQKRISRALDRLRQLLGKRGLAVTTGLLTAGLASDTHAATAGTLTATVATSVLRNGVGVHWWYRALPHVRAAVAGVVGVGSIAAVPLWKHHQAQLTGASVIAASPAPAIPARPAMPQMKFTPPAEIPKMELGLDVTEIVRRVVVLAGLPQTELTHLRGWQLLSSIKNEDVLRAIDLLGKAFPTEPPDFEWLANGIERILEIMGEMDSAKTIPWIESHLQGEFKIRCLCWAIPRGENNSLAKITKWLPILCGKVSNYNTKEIIKSILSSAIRRTPVVEAVDAMIGLANKYDSTLPIDAIKNRIGSRIHNEEHGYEYFLAALERIDSPLQRKQLRSEILTAWKARDISAVHAWVEQLPPRAQQEYASAAALPKEPDRTFGVEPPPPEDWTPHADWLLRVDPQSIAKISVDWNRHAPPQMLAWLEAKPELAASFLRGVIQDVLFVALPEDDKARAVKQQQLDEMGRPYVQLWKKSDPAGLEKFVQGLVTVTHKEILQRLSQP